MNVYGKWIAINLYCLVGILEYFLIRISKTGGQSFENSKIVVTVEFSKLLVCAFLYALWPQQSPNNDSKTSGSKQLGSSWFLFYDLFQKSNLRWGYLYLIPAFLYALYNNLTLFNLGQVEPSTFQILMQSRLLITAILMQFILYKPLKFEKWLALMVLILGICLKNLKLDQNQFLGIGLLTVGFIFLQASLSSLASVLNEKFFKQEMEQSIFLQNGYLYFFGTLINGLFNLRTITATSWSLDQELFNPYFWGIVLCGVTVGLSASFIIKHLDTVIKSVYSTLEISATAIISYFLLGTQLSLLDVISCLLVSFSVYWYNHPTGAKNVVLFRPDHRQEPVCYI